MNSNFFFFIKEVVTRQISTFLAHVSTGTSYAGSAHMWHKMCVPPIGSVGVGNKDFIYTKDENNWSVNAKPINFGC